MQRNAPAMRPFFMPGTSGDLFSLYFPPRAPQSAQRGILYFPPFAEELNKSRRMIALQARRFAEAGYAVLLVDLYGTGDSAGDFADARWEIWRSDMLLAARWLAETGVHSVVAWGLRSGALLALDVAGELTPPIERLLLWQPVIRGEQMMTQFLRLRLAADLTSPGEKITTQDLRARLASGERIEIAGYTLAPELVSRVDALDLKTMVSSATAPIDWLEITAVVDKPLTPVSRGVVDAWKQQGCNVHAATVQGEPFWNSLEIEIAPALIERSLQCLAASRA